MPAKEEIFTKLREALRKGDSKGAKATAADALTAGIDSLEAISVSTDEMRKIGIDFQEGNIFLPHVMMAAEAMKEIINVLTPKIPAGQERKYLGKVVIGTVLGDVHDLGKNIVATMMEAAGFQVFNVGRDITPEVFIKKAIETNSNIIGASALMTTTLLEQKTLIEKIKKVGIREKIKYMVGGAPVTEDWVKMIGADARGEDAIDAVSKAKQLLGAQ